jgi:hypothetical protein
MIRVRLNDNIAVDVNTNDQQAAAAAGRRWFQQNHPQEFEAWRQTQLGLGSSLSRGTSAGIDQFQSNLFSAAEGLGRAVGSESLERFGREGRVRNQAEAEAAFPSELRQPFTEVEGVGGAARATTEAVTGSLPATATGLGGALLGAKLGAPLGPAGAIIGGLAGGAAASFPLLFGSNIERQVQERGDITSPGAAAAAAAVQAPLESAADVLTLGASRFLRRPATEAAQATGASLGRRLATGAAVGAGLEAPVEVAQTGLERAQAGLPVFTTEDGAGREYLEAALGGAAAGGVTGAALRGAFGERPASPETAAIPEGAFPAVPSAAPAEAKTASLEGLAPEPYFARTPVPQSPELLRSPEQAEAFVASDPDNYTPPPALTTPEARLAWVNSKRQADHQQEVQTVRESAISNFAATQPDTFFNNLAQAAAEGNLKSLNRFSANDVANAALRSSDIEPGRLTKEERQFVNEQLNTLANAGVLSKPAATSFSVSFDQRQQTAPTPEVLPTRREREASQRDIAEITAAAEAGTTGRISPFEARRLGAETLPRQQPTPGPEVAAPAEPTTPIAEVGQVPEAAPVPDMAAQWQGYSLNAGPQANSPAVVAARNEATTRGRSFTRPEFEAFVNQYNATATPNAGTVPSAPEAAPVQTAEQLAAVAAEADPASGAGERTETAEEAIFATPKNETIQKQQKILDKQIEDGFRGGFSGKVFASPIATFGKQPAYRDSANQMDRLYVHNHTALNEVTVLFEPALTLPSASQARIALALQEGRSRKQRPNPDAFTAEENAAMDGLLQAGQRMLDYYIDAYTTKFFNPADATTAQDRTKLEAFQQAKGDRLITEMTDAELRTASEDGAREVRRLNSNRDPLFFPQVSQGTHFAAAYERQPGGKEKLVRIYFFDPVRGVRKARQKLGIQRDPEAEAIRALREEFPDTSRFRVMQRGVEAENDSRAADLRRDGDFIAQYLQELSKVSGKEAKQIIARMSKEIDKAQMDRIFRPNNDLLRAVTPANAVDYVRDTLPAYFIAASKIQARRVIQDDFNRSLDGYSNEEKQYWNDLLNYSTTPTEAFGTGRALAFFMFLGFNVSTAVIQMTQNPTVLVPRLLRDGGGRGAIGYYLSASKDVYGTLDAVRVLSKELEQTKRLIRRGVLKPDEVAALQRALRDGRLNPVQAVELRSTVSAADLRNAGVADRSATSFARGLNKALDLSGRMLATVDETNRVTAFLAAYRLAKARPEVLARAGKLDNRTYKDAYEYAAGVTGDTNFRSTKEDRALIQRFHPIAEMMTQFMSPVFKLMELYARSARQTIMGLRQGDLVMARAAALQFTAMTAAQVALAGVWSLPLTERLRDLTEGILKLVFDDIVDYEQELEKALGNGFAASAFSYGMPHAWGSISLNSRLKIDPLPQGSVSQWDVLSVFGPVGGLAQKGLDMYQAWNLGDYWGLAYAMLPTAFANVAKGAQLATDEEQFTKRQGRIITPEQVRAASESGFLPPAAQQAVGFAPPEFADIRRTANRQRELQMATRNATERVNIELSRIVLRAMEAQTAGRAADAQALIQQYRQRANEIRAEQQDKPQEYQVQINESAIMQRARQDFQGRGSPEVLMQGTRTPARPAAQEMIERSQWRN